MAKILNCYFPHDSNARNDRKIIRLLRIHGWKGYGLYFALIEILREQEDFKYPLNQISELEYELRESKEVIFSIIKDFDLFLIDESNNFFSISLIARMQPFLEKSKRAIEANKIRWESAKKQLNQTNTIQMDIQMDSVSESKENRIEENKIKEIKDIVAKATKPKHSIEEQMKELEFELALYRGEFPEQMLKEFYDYWSEPNLTKTKIRKNTEKTWDVKKRLDRWAKNNKNFSNNNGHKPTAFNSGNGKYKSEPAWMK